MTARGYKTLNVSDKVYGDIDLLRWHWRCKSLNAVLIRMIDELKKDEEIKKVLEEWY